MLRYKTGFMLYNMYHVMLIPHVSCYVMLYNINYVIRCAILCYIT